MQNQRSSSTRPHKRTSGSFSQPASASRTPRRPSSPQKTSVPLAEHPYARSAGGIYSGGERAIFRKQSQARRNTIVLCIMAGLCIIMAGILIGFSLGKGAALAEAGTATDEVSPTPAAVSYDELEEA